ncbi:ATP-grasp domain-containing protein [Planctomicrobium sp. SH664]|uniref:ATP-grasp domain-containing protein n=1 Tax=Planctomicrobium sp. SH664 TaxID=3448125 RepID=UPI003F5BABEA
MQLFLSEYLCSGALADQDPPESLLLEGRAMWQALVEDCAALPGVHVSTTLDARLPYAESLNRPNIAITRVDSVFAADEQFTQLAEQADAALVVAPEFHDLLATQAERLTACGTKTLLSIPDAIRLCADKLRLYEFCSSREIPTIPTVPAAPLSPWEATVLKLRDGAGSLGTRLVRGTEELQAALAEIDPDDFIAQPYVIGRALSVAAIFHNGQPVALFPPAEQLLSADRRLQYLGSQLPAPHVSTDRLHAFVARVGRQISGLQGYVGFDLLLPDESPEQPLLVEINPRLTTSYLAYRELAKENLARWLIDPTDSCPPEFSGAVRMTVGDTFHFHKHS